LDKLSNVACVAPQLGAPRFPGDPEGLLVLNRKRILIIPALLASLSACKAVVLDPSGDVATQQANLVIVSTILMLLIIVPVIVLTLFFAWRYRQSNKEARYEPDWSHSTQLELLIWTAPLLIIICLGALTWLSTHLLDPYRALGRVSAEKQLTAEAKPLQVDVVALDWKWLFIYPEYGIATVNELAAPVDRPIQFKITSSHVMNSFYIPALAGQIYAMPGMETSLNAVINKSGTYKGISANYSGIGFSGMHFAFYGMQDGDFQKWVEKAKGSKGALDRANYLKLEQPSENVPVARYATVENGLYGAILNMCVQPGTMCENKLMATDAKNDAKGRLPAPEDVAPASPMAAESHAGPPQRSANDAPIVGAGLPRPDSLPSRLATAAQADAQTRPSHS
jgi:cytochrome o ubiquinol oxidase subunit 2